MYVHRARTACPHCNTEEEVWYYNSAVSPISTIQCFSCGTLFEAEEYIQNLIELYQNVTVSASEIVATLNI